jgi:hypothetical protein
MIRKLSRLICRGKPVTLLGNQRMPMKIPEIPAFPIKILGEPHLRGMIKKPKNM